MNILFVCTGNTCRSAMAAAIMNRIADERYLDIRIESAGIFADGNYPANDKAIETLKDYGIDLSYHRSQPVTDKLIVQCDLVLTMTEAHKQFLAKLAAGKVYTLSEYVGEEGDIADPIYGTLDTYREVAKELYRLLELLADKLSEGK